MPSHAAAREMLEEGLNSADIAQVLEEGKETDEKRAEGIVEKTLGKGETSIKAVVALSHNNFFGTDYWVKDPRLKPLQTFSFANHR